MQVEQEKLNWLKKLKLKHGSHDAPDEGACVMEAVAFVAGEPFSDHPKCASKVITRFCVRLNDRWDDKQRQRLKPYVLRIAGTAANEATERKRAFMCADWAARELLPLVFEKHPKESLRPWAEKLRSLAPVVDRATADKAGDLAREARSAAAADADADAAAAVLRTRANASALGLLERLIAVSETSKKD